jgi:SAM-dependent methyltransferase
MKKFQPYKIWLIFIAVFSFACDSGNTNTTTANNTNAVNTNVNSVANATKTPADAAMVDEVVPRELDVPYVPTHQSIVDEMLKMAEVKGTDVLYDLGSGDGRIPITAAERFGTRGVGIDLNPERIKEANANAEKAKVTDKVKFIEGDIFEQDFSEATVVALYLLPEVNMKLRPKILDMKPGTRVVSHNYDMGDWKPEQSKTMDVNGTTHYIYFWRVPEKK